MNNDKWDKDRSIDNMLVKDAIGLQVRFFNTETGRYKLGKIVHICSSYITLQLRDGLVRRVARSFIELPKETK